MRCGRRRSCDFSSCVELSAGEARFSGVAAVDAVEAWLSARATVAGSVLSCCTANLDQVASVGSSLVRLWGGSVASFTGAVGHSVFRVAYSSRCCSSLVWGRQEFPAIRQLLHVLSPGAPGGVARVGDLHAEIAYGNHPSVASHEVAI